MLYRKKIEYISWIETKERFDLHGRLSLIHRNSANILKWDSRLYITGRDRFILCIYEKKEGAGFFTSNHNSIAERIAIIIRPGHSDNITNFTLF